MRVFKVSDGTSWTARADEGDDNIVDGRRAGWSAIVFEGGPPAAAQRLVYRPAGWLDEATLGELVAALEESVTVRLRWGDDPAA